MNNDKTKILIVEDQLVIAANIKILLKHKNYDISGIAKTGEEALNMISLNKPNLVVMDISLPGVMDGIDAANMIKAKWDIPVIYLTARTDDETFERAKVSAASAFFTKDIMVQEQLPLMIEFALYKHNVELERMRTQQTIKNKEEILDSIISNVSDAIVLINAQGKISLWNRGAEKIFGYNGQETYGAFLYDLIATDDKSKQYLKRGLTDFAYTGHGIFTGHSSDLQARNKNGKTFPIELSLDSVKIKDEWCACGIIRDISERKNAEFQMAKLINDLQDSKSKLERKTNELIHLNNKLAKSEEALQELNTSKDKFFSIIAHDLKNPFQGFLGNSEILLKRIDYLSKQEIKELSADLNSSANMLFKLLENLLQWSRIQRGKLDINPEKINLKQIFDLNIDLLKSNASQKNIDIINDISPEINIFADVNFVNTIFRNILNNAVKFSYFNGIVKCRAAMPDVNSVKIAIEDKGVGMDEDMQSKLFKIDTQITTVGTDDEIGTGLGLVLCKELVDLSGGSITVTSNPNKGSIFVIDLPRYREE